MQVNRNRWIHNARRIVIKVGSNVLTVDNGLNLAAIRSISAQICQLIDAGREVLLVSSGSMAAGLRKLNLRRRPDEIPKRQAISAVGQPGLMVAYEEAFGRFDKKVAQILLTGEDLSNRQRYLNSRNALYQLMQWEVVPIINENDTVRVEEIQFGDNDHLSAMIALLMEADLLVNLTDIDGLFDQDPRIHPDAQLIPEVKHITPAIEKMAGGIPGALGTGGMSTKIKAAQKMTTAGIPMIIANGLKQKTLIHLFDGQAGGTFFTPKENRLASRKCWLAYSLKPKGGLIIDEGAANAVVYKGKSLLPGGILAVEGHFDKGAPVAFSKPKGPHLGVGLVNYSSEEIRQIRGLKSSQIKSQLGEKPYDEVIHRDNMAITTQPEPETVECG